VHFKRHHVKSKPEHATLSTACCPSLPLRFGPTLLAAKQATRLKATPRRTQRRNDRANTWQLLAAEPVACRTAAAAGAWSKERRRNGCHPLAATSRIELVGCLARWGLDKIKEGRRALAAERDQPKRHCKQSCLRRGHSSYVGLKTATSTRRLKPSSQTRNRLD